MTNPTITTVQQDNNGRPLAVGEIMSEEHTPLGGAASPKSPQEVTVLGGGEEVDRPLPPPQANQQKQLMFLRHVPQWIHTPPRPPHLLLLLCTNLDWWWWGAMLLSLSLVTLRLWLADQSGVYPRTVEEYNTNLKGHWGYAVAYGVLEVVWFNLPAMLVLTLLCRAACRNAAVSPPRGGLPLAPPSNVFDNTDAAGFDNTLAGGAGTGFLGGLDRQTLVVAGKWCSVSVVATTVGQRVIGPGGDAVGFVCTYAFAALYLLPRAVARWLEEGGSGGAGAGGGGQTLHQRSRKLIALVVRTMFVGVPMIILQIYLGSLLRVMSAQNLSFIYPYVLSFVEYLMVTHLFNDRVVEGHSDEALSIIARWVVALIEVGRVGLLVVTYNTGTGTFQGFMLATLNSALVEVLNRTGVLLMALEALKVQYLHGGGCRCRNRPRFRLLPLSKLGTFDRVHLGCKVDTDYWPAYMLVVMRVLDFGMVYPAHDPTTGELLPALRCGVEVVAVVLGGEMLGDVCTYGVEWAVGRWWPRYRLHIVSVRPRRSLVVVVLMWLNVGMFSVNGIGGSGVLVEEMENK